MKMRDPDPGSPGVPRDAAVTLPLHPAVRTVAWGPRTVTAVPVRGRFGRGASVGYVIDRFPRNSHGFVLHEILALERRGVDVHVFSLGMPDGSHADTAAALARLQSPVAYFLADTETSQAPDPCGSGMTSRAAHWLALQVSARGIEHLHAHGAAAAADVVREASRMTRCGYSFTAHALDLHDGVAASVREKILEAQFAVALSEFDHARLLGICGRGAADKLHSIPMSVDPQDYEFGGREHLRHAILTVGPLVEGSGVLDLIEALRLLRSRGIAARATIVGDGALEAALRARVDRYRLTPHVAIVRCASRLELDALIRTHTVMALLWTAEHGDRDVLSNLLLEGMAAGLPVLAADGPSIRELLDDGLNGRVLRAGDPLGLAGALETLFTSPRLRASMASNARSTVEQEFAAGRNVAHLATLFSAAVAGKTFIA